MDNLATPYHGLRDWRRVAVQGNPGNYAHMAVQKIYPDAKVMFYATFEDAAAAVPHEADGALLPIENNTMGRVGDIHHLLPHLTLYVVAEVYQPITHCLLAPKGATLQTLKVAYSQWPALAQCPQTLKALGLKPMPTADTAGAAKDVAARGDITEAAIASRLAGKIYGLEVIKEGVNDKPNNTTRFVALGPVMHVPDHAETIKFSLMFGVKNQPGSLVKALEAFALNGINLTKLESYDDTARFSLTHFYAEGEGNLAGEGLNGGVRKAIETLKNRAEWVKELGFYVPESMPNINI